MKFGITNYSIKNDLNRIDLDFNPKDSKNIY